MKPRTGQVTMTEALDLVISVPCSRWETALPDCEDLARQTVIAAFARAPHAPCAYEAGLVLDDDKAIQELNRKYRGKDQPTNVLSFSAGDGPPLPEGAPLPLGDVVVALETAAKEAKEQSKSLRDHFSHLVTHGMLHLMGYDHQTDDEAVAMESLEILVLADLKIANPYGGCAK